MCILLDINTIVSQYNERRIDTRYALKEAVALKIIFASDNPSLLGRSLTGSTVDVSASGLKIILNSIITIDSTVDVRVTLKHNFKEYYLSGKVKWCDQFDSENYYVGIALQECQGTQTDFKEWCSELASIA